MQVKLLLITSYMNGGGRLHAVQCSFYRKTVWIDVKFLDGSVLKNECEPNFGFPHIPTECLADHLWMKYSKALFVSNVRVKCNISCTVESYPAFYLSITTHTQTHTHTNDKITVSHCWSQKGQETYLHQAYKYKSNFCLLLSWSWTSCPPPHHHLCQLPCYVILVFFAFSAKLVHLFVKVERMDDQMDW